jgi:hypothetical protein
MDASSDLGKICKPVNNTNLEFFTQHHGSEEFIFCGLKT